ncbi:hypothetical protein [Haloplanus sp. C73]|uniref:hypothetical protein n=1 Tax=Haloplanus sp. C73 TaxID=3421641 RepID=UPI003EB98091
MDSPQTSNGGDVDGPPSYFFVAVSTKQNLDLCREYGLAGFPGSQNGAWTFADIEVGDYVSFVYGANAYDLYEVGDKRAVLNAEDLPPWPPLELTRGGTYHFPFRLDLQPKRTLEENLVRSEFRYIAENLLLRGGYSRSHFQADKTTLQQVSQMGRIETTREISADWSSEEGTTHWVRRRGDFHPPEVNKFIEEILHVLLRRRLSTQTGLAEFAQLTGFSEVQDQEMEVLGERALPEGHLDILLKDSEPVGRSVRLPIEVKLNRCDDDDLQQLRNYMTQLQPECPGGVLLAETIPRDFDVPDDVALLRATFSGVDMGEPRTIPEMEKALTLERVER